jgi:hypothetical protein
MVRKEKSDAEDGSALSRQEGLSSTGLVSKEGVIGGA